MLPGTPIALVGTRSCVINLRNTTENDVRNNSSHLLCITSGLETVFQAHEEFNWATRCVQLALDKKKVSYVMREVTPHVYRTGQSHRHKTVPNFYGPVSVLDMVGSNSVRLDLLESIKLQDVLWLWSNHLQRAGGQEAPSVNISGQVEWEVVSIINDRMNKVKRKSRPVIVEFLGTCEGGYENCWHEFVDLEGCIETWIQYLRSF